MFLRTRRDGDVNSHSHDGVTGFLQELEHFRSHVTNIVAVLMITGFHVASEVCCVTEEDGAQ